MAKVQLRAFIGTAVEADVVKLYISRAADTHDDERCVAVCCAVCDDMREDLILTASVVDKLCTSHIIGVNVDHLPWDKDDDEVCDDQHDDDHSNSQENPDNVNDKTVSANVVKQSDGYEYGPPLPSDKGEIHGRNEDVTSSDDHNNTDSNIDVIQTANSSVNTVPKTVRGQSVCAVTWLQDIYRLCVFIIILLFIVRFMFWILLF